MFQKIATPLLVLILPFFEKPDLHAQTGNFSVPFHLIAKLIMVEASAAEQKGLFIVDTGSPELILNTAHFGQRRSNATMRGLDGQAVHASFAFFPFTLAQIRLKSKRALLTDLSHIEEKRNIEILGVIGYSILKEFEILIDYDTKKLTFLQLDKNGDRLYDPEARQAPDHIISFDLRDHFPCLNVQVGLETIYVAIDSGAGVNVLDAAIKQQLAPYCFMTKEVQVKSFNLEGIQTQVLLLEGTQLQGLYYTAMPAIFHHMEKINDHLVGKKIRGLLGYEFLRQYKTSINYRKKELSIWEKETPQHLAEREKK